MQIIYNNLAASATFTGLTEHPRYLYADTMARTQLSTYARTLDVDDQWIKMTFTATVAVDYFAILSHNLTSAAVVHIQANASDVWTAPSVDEVVTVATLITHKFTATKTYRYWRVTIDDPTNTAGYIQFSKMWLSSYLQMPPMSPDATLPYTSNSDISESITGQLYGDKRVRLASFEIAFPSIITDTQRKAINTMFDVVDITVPFILLLWEDSLTVQPALYCSLTESPAFKKDAQSLLFSTSIKMKERR